MNLHLSSSSKLDTPSKKFGRPTTTIKYSKSGESSRAKAPYKFENDFQWLVNDSFEVIAIKKDYNFQISTAFNFDRFGLRQFEKKIWIIEFVFLD